MSPDVNVLVAAFRADHPHHPVARDWLIRARDDCARGKESLTLLPMAIAGFLRIVTSPRVFLEPDTIEDAIAFLDAILEVPGVEMRHADSEWALLRSTLLSLGLKGNLVTDAWIAAAVLRKKAGW